MMGSTRTLYHVHKTSPPGTATQLRQSLKMVYTHLNSIPRGEFGQSRTK